ncbi:MAG: hypothetical protein R6T99_10235 [Bacteroidales bacterium]
MPTGTIPMYFGDALRILANNAAEDETAPDKITYNLAYFKASTRNFLEKARSCLHTK